MGQYHDKEYPGESGAYRTARDKLLSAEIDLRAQVEAVAAQRRALPLGGAIWEDYAFDEGTRKIKLSDLFEGEKDSLFLYSFMYAPDGAPCPMYTAFLDSLNGNAPHISQRINLAVVAKAPIAQIRDFGGTRGWRNLRLLSSGGNSYNTDYFAEAPDGSQLSSFNVFQRTANGIFHQYASEMFFAPTEDGQHPRHVDMLWPLWNVFDVTPAGRGTDCFPSISHS